MPRLDRTGPKGKGSRSGRGLGKCNSHGEKQDAQNDSEEKLREEVWEEVLEQKGVRDADTD